MPEICGKQFHKLAGEIDAGPKFSTMSGIVNVTVSGPLYDPTLPTVIDLRTVGTPLTEQYCAKVDNVKSTAVV